MKCPQKRFIIEGFRGVAKSFITCAYIVWCLWNNPQLKCLIVSASKDRADANAVFIRRIIYLLDFLSDLKPRDGQRNTQNLFDVGLAIPDISPSVKSVGITGQITGSRADILVADDVEIPNNSSTQVRRDKLFEDVKEFDAIIKPGDGSKIIYLGTPQNEMSLYNELQNRGYGVYVFPIIYPETPLSVSTTETNWLPLSLNHMIRIQSCMQENLLIRNDSQKKKLRNASCPMVKQVSPYSLN